MMTQNFVDMITNTRNRNYKDIDYNQSDLAHTFTSFTAFLKNSALSVQHLRQCISVENGHLKS